MDENLSSSASIKRSKKQCHYLKLASIRLSLKFRPKIYNLIVKMRQCIRKRNILIKKLKSDIKQKVSLINRTTDFNIRNEQDSVKQSNNDAKSVHNADTNAPMRCDRFTQTTEIICPAINIDKACTNTKVNVEHKVIECKDIQSKIPKDLDNKESPGWVLNDNGDNEKSIAEQVKEVAENALGQTGMVYVESAGMYYDYKTGYYYSAELGLYYHTDTGCYYYYSNENKTFVFHSYPDKTIENHPVRTIKPKKAKKHKQTAKSEDIENLTKSLSQENEEVKPKKKKIKLNEVTVAKIDEQDSNKDTVFSDTIDIKTNGIVEEDENLDRELEDGECSDTDSEKSEALSEASTSTASDDESVAKRHPPCMRIIVRQTDIPKLKVGSLYLITKDGGTIGREGDHHAILIKDNNISRNHLEIRYDLEKSMYFAVDLGSKNGTILNGVRMSECQEISYKKEVVHGSTIQIGETKLLCHIHSGNDTCGHCEPGLIMESQEKENKLAYTRTCSVQKQHQLELARLKNKYAPQPLAIEEKPYNDRAQARREKVGSSHGSEKTQSADLNTFIAPENKGFKLLEKMGWSKGEGLGKDCQGDQEPIPIVSNEGKAGLGSVAGPMTTATKKSSTIVSATLRLANKTKMLQPPAKAFQQPADEDSE